jgi:hypothetical protein
MKDSHQATTGKVEEGVDQAALHVGSKLSLLEKVLRARTPHLQTSWNLTLMSLSYPLFLMTHILPDALRRDTEEGSGVTRLEILTIISYVTFALTQYACKHVPSS